MSAVIVPLFDTRPAKARGAGIATAIMARRYGLTDDQAERMAAEARTLVQRGHSAAHARSLMLKRIQRLAPQVAA